MYENPHHTIKWTKKYFLINVYLVFKDFSFCLTLKAEGIFLFLLTTLKRQTQLLMTKQNCIFYDVYMGMVIPLSFCCKAK